MTCESLDPPAVSSAELASATRAAEQRLRAVYATLPGGSDTPDKEAVRTAEKRGISSIGQFIYGEAGSGDVGLVLQSLRLESDDVFYDLGSGRGRLVLGAACMPPGATGACARAVGVELDANRHSLALRAAAALGPTDRPYSLLNEDMLDTCMDEATVAFCNNVVFGGPLSGAVAESLNEARAPKLRSLLTTAALPQPQASAAGLALHRVSVVPVNWCQAGHTLYHYARVRPPTGSVEVDPEFEAMIGAMRQAISNDNLSPNSQDMALMRVVAFAQEVRTSVQDWHSFYAKESSE